MDTPKHRTLPLRSLNHISLVVSDVRRSAAFYAEILGFVEVKRPASFNFEGSWLFNYGLGIHLIRGQPPQRPSAINPKNDHLSFQSDSLIEVLARLEDLGIEYCQQTITEDGMKVSQVFFHDPDHNMIEICNCDVLPVVPLQESTFCTACLLSSPTGPGSAAAAVAAQPLMAVPQAASSHLRRNCSSNFGAGAQELAHQLAQV